MITVTSGDPMLASARRCGAAVVTAASTLPTRGPHLTSDAFRRFYVAFQSLRILGICGAFLLGHMLAAPSAIAQKKYDEGASDTEIRIGNTNPYTGPASAFGAIGKTIE